MPTKNNRPIPVLVKPGLVLILISIIALVGIILNRESTQPAVTDSTNQPETTNWQRVNNANAIFFSKIFLDRSKTFILIPIKFESGVQIAWMSLISSPSAQPQSFLITHPALEKMTWNRLDRGVVHLYQRHKTYKSVDDFVKNPPADRVAIEKDIQQLDYYQKIQGVPFDENFNLDQVDYLLTTYTQPSLRDGAYYYENIIDASFGEVNQNDNLSWQLYVPSASETNPFYLGNIHIDYRR